MSNNINLMTESSLRTENDILKGLLLLLLAVGGNFISETVSCQVRDFFNKNMIAKNILIYFLLFFSISVFTKINPLIHLIFSFFIYILYLLINKGNLRLTVINYLIIAIIFFIHNIILYYENEKLKNNKIHSFLKKTRKNTNLFNYYLFSFIIIDII